MSGTQQLQARSRTTAGCLLIVVGAVFGGVGSAFALTGVAAMWDEVGWFGVAFGGVGSLFALGGLIGIGFGIRNLWLSRVLGRMALELSQEEPLGLGGTKIVRFRRSGGAARAAQAPTATAELSCRESVTYRQGTDTHTVNHEIFRGPLTVFPEPVPGSVTGRVEILVPLSYPPTIALRNNRIIWELTLRVAVAGVPDDVSTFALPVVPLVAEAALRRDGRPGGGKPR